MSHAPSLAEPLVSTPARSRTFAALIDNLDYRKFYVGQGISLIGTWLQDAAVGWIVFEMTGSESMLGLISAAGTFPGVIVGILAGALADRVQPKAMILGMQVGQMLFALLLAFLVWTKAVQIWQMALILALTRICVTFEMPSRQVFLYDLVGKSSMMNAIALNSGLFNASKVLGPTLAGLCLVYLGRTACFTLNGASYLAAIAALLMIRRIHRPARHGAAGPGDLWSGLAHLRRDRFLRNLFLYLGTFGVIGMGYSALIPAYAKNVVHTGTSGYSVLLAASGIGATVGALVIASLGGMPRRGRIASAGMAIFGVALGISGIIPPLLDRANLSVLALVAAAVGMFLAGFGALTFYATVQTMIQINVPDGLRGRIMGLWMIVFSASVPLGSLWAGVLAHKFGVAAVLEVSAALCLMTAVKAVGGMKSNL